MTRLNRYVRRKRDKELDFKKSCHTHSFRLERYNHTYSKYKKVDIVVSDEVAETNYRYSYKELFDYFNDRYFRFRYVRIHWLVYPDYKWLLYGDRHAWTRGEKIYQGYSEEYYVKNYDYYRNIQKKEWKKSHRYDEMELISTGRDRLHAYLGNIVKEYNSGFEDLTDEKLSNKVDLFNKYDWRY